ncbi:hypothetical protein ANN_15642 [Periplaneta americana]|uniref:Uncharacterized protein n=1 Tax=Periplaneta americana TaxID=6978 RepID=A0ABQ8SH62_PERAM|nr:hypothetical protein ANN_15642 [Periplaneta americana]
MQPAIHSKGGGDDDVNDDNVDCCDDNADGEEYVDGENDDVDDDSDGEESQWWRRVDIIAINRQQQKAIITDPTIRMERDLNQAHQVDHEKTAIYEPSLPPATNDHIPWDPSSVAVSSLTYAKKKKKKKKNGSVIMMAKRIRDLTLKITHHFWFSWLKENIEKKTSTRGRREGIEGDEEKELKGTRRRIEGDEEKELKGTRRRIEEDEEKD